MSRPLATRLMSAGLIVALLCSILHVNLAAAAPAGAVGLRPTASHCAGPLTSQQMAAIRGGQLLDWLQDAAGALTGALDAGCAVGGIAAALGATIDPIGAAFCAGWGLGRVLF